MLHTQPMFKFKSQVNTTREWCGTVTHSRTLLLVSYNHLAASLRVVHCCSFLNSLVKHETYTAWNSIMHSNSRLAFVHCLSFGMVFYAIICVLVLLDCYYFSLSLFIFAFQGLRSKKHLKCSKTKSTVLSICTWNFWWKYSLEPSCAQFLSCYLMLADRCVRVLTLKSFHLRCAAYSVLWKCHLMSSHINRHLTIFSEALMRILVGLFTLQLTGNDFIFI